MRDEVISLMKWILEMLLPRAFWLLNLLRRVRFFQSHMLHRESALIAGISGKTYQILSASSVTPKIES